MVKNDSKGTAATINESRFPITVSGEYDPAEILATAKAARRRAVISTLCVAPIDGRCVIALDTTGLDPDTDEIISAIVLDSAREQVVYFGRFRPVGHASWHAAQGVHGISPEDVSALAPIGESVDEIQDVINSYNEVVSYNAAFVAGFLDAAGLELSGVTFVDPMVEYAHYRAGLDDNPAYVSLAQAMSEINGSPAPVPADITKRVLYANAVQLFLDTCHATLAKQFGLA